jgi:hypothetical protein
MEEGTFDFNFASDDEDPLVPDVVMDHEPDRLD